MEMLFIAAGLMMGLAAIGAAIGIGVLDMIGFLILMIAVIRSN